MAEKNAQAGRVSSAAGSPVSKYKGLLRKVLDSRPSGTRQRLADEIGKNRSFISQISNPAYPTPIPVEHVERVLDVCHFSPQERNAFLEAYRRAHPRRFKKIEPPHGTRVLKVTVPDLGNAGANRAFDQLVEEMVTRVERLLDTTGDAEK